MIGGRPAAAGNYGVMDPASKDLHTYLGRLEEQQRQARHLPGSPLR